MLLLLCPLFLHSQFCPETTPRNSRQMTIGKNPFISFLYLPFACFAQTRDKILLRFTFWMSSKGPCDKGPGCWEVVILFRVRSSRRSLLPGHKFCKSQYPLTLCSTLSWLFLSLWILLQHLQSACRVLGPRLEHSASILKAWVPLPAPQNNQPTRNKKTTWQFLPRNIVLGFDPDCCVSWTAQEESTGLLYWVL